MVANSEHPKVIQVRLGHADPAVSLGIYASVSPGTGRAAAERLDHLFGFLRNELGTFKPRRVDSELT